jgi:D-alanyl-D-alanine carboxypeptidase
MGKVENKAFKWKNSNILLKKGFNGIKTGVTPAAGPCMATSFCKEGIHLIVIVLDCKNVQNRWDDSVKLTFWGYNRLSAILSHFKSKSTAGTSKTDDTTASSGQSSNSQNKIAKNKEKGKKIIKNRSRRFTAEKRQRSANQPEQEAEEEKKLSSEWDTFPEAVIERRPLQKEESYLFSEADKDFEEEENQENGDEYAEIEQYYNDPEVENPSDLFGDDEEDMNACIDDEISEP